MKVNSNGLRMGHIIMGRFRYGCQPTSVRPNDPIIVGFAEEIESDEDFNRHDDSTRSRVPYQVLCIDAMEEDDTNEQFLGLRAHYSPGRLIVLAERLSPAPDFARVPGGERIVFGIGPHLPGRNEPFVEWVERLGRRTSSGGIELVEYYEMLRCAKK